MAEQNQSVPQTPKAAYDLGASHAGAGLGPASNHNWHPVTRDHYDAGFAAEQAKNQKKSG